ncbi:alkaline serine protease [Minicystis rosea]|nr:alkaline serine protease [Minicystis rosea]
MLRRVAGLLTAALVLPILADRAAASPALGTKLDPGIERAIKTGIIGPWHRVRPEPGSAPVVIELVAPATPTTLAMLRAMGAELDDAEGEIVHYDRFVAARIGPVTAAALDASPAVAHVALRPARGPLPLDHSAELIRVEDARGARPALDLLTGKGVLVGDVDSAADIFHPSFFHGDAGYFDWIDVDGDGVLTPGIDAIDLDHDGEVGPDEVAAVIRADTWVDYLGGSQPARPSGFDPSIDWLFLDQNHNGQRDYGAAGGFDDTAPAFGEPLFVPDDVNRNGKLDVGERVIRLGTSKFQKVNIRLNYPPLKLNTKHVFARGTDLAALPTDFSHGQLYGFADALHATGVLGIVAGDVPLAGRRWVGIAPEAEIVLAFEVDQFESLPMSATNWALNQKPDVMLYEMAPWTGVALDGSDSLSLAIDTSTEKSGVIHTCPTGDQASAHKHARAQVAAGGTASLPLDVPEKPKAGAGPITYVDVTMHVQGGVPAALTLTSPNNDVIDVLTSGQGKIASTGADYYAVTQTTKRGVFLADVILYANDETTPLPTGDWTVSVTGAAAAPLTVDGYVSDDKSSWALGAGWAKAIADDAITIGVPSTADHCIAVGAHPSHTADPEAPWFNMYYQPYDVPSGFVEAQTQVRAYSPLGPRLDGVQKPDVLAPDNPWTAQQTGGTDEGGPPYGSFQVFGGTSGASPHVTGAAALLAQAGIRGDDAREAIRMGAATDALSGKVPNGSYGYGRLDVAAALGVTTKGTRPTLSLKVTPAKPTTKDTVTITPETTGGVEIKWDDDYDGTWDQGYAQVAGRQIQSATPLTRPFKARVRNATGHIAEAVVWVTFSEPGATPPPDDGGCGCRTTSDAGSLGPAALALAGLAVAARRRRNRRS